MSLVVLGDMQFSFALTLFLHLDFKVGSMVTMKRAELPEATVKYNKLLQEIKEEGLFETDMSFYYKLCAWLAILYCTAWYLMVKGHWVAGAFAVAAFWQQVIVSSGMHDETDLQNYPLRSSDAVHRTIQYCSCGYQSVLTSCNMVQI